MDNCKLRLVGVDILCGSGPASAACPEPEEPPPDVPRRSVDQSRTEHVDEQIAHEVEQGKHASTVALLAHPAKPGKRDELLAVKFSRLAASA